jgi:hypothetical protein
MSTSASGEPIYSTVPQGETQRRDLKLTLQSADNFYDDKFMGRGAMTTRNRGEVRTDGGAASIALNSLVLLLLILGLQRGLQAQGGGGGGLMRSPCDWLDLLRNEEQDASPFLQACIDSIPAGGVLEIRPGNYTLGTSIKISKPIVMKTR